MKLLKLPLLAVLAILICFSCSTDSVDDKENTIVLSNDNIEAKAIETEILVLINDHRSALGLNSLQEMKIVKSVAFSHTDYMVDNEKISHDNFYTRSDYLKSNANAKKVSENVAYGYSSAKSVVDAWLRSEGHKANIEGDYTNFDISAEKSEDGRWYYTNIFIKK
ncbi:hypothetical protein A8C32_02750 [Flavivirga aquatica]|uniref:SCP domain-containing protein n=1 Tax=Flavivirga aquatica TaxID=1849968 RepID=A0A1E5TBC4_9FLAO|nr:CAP domain-containing protein [Flavivirga aquatica]OEK08685.1 hypothetical protein A8C32_02750 [Flavivirga aquatica]